MHGILRSVRSLKCIACHPDLSSTGESGKDERVLVVRRKKVVDAWIPEVLVRSLRCIACRLDLSGTERRVIEMKEC